MIGLICFVAILFLALAFAIGTLELTGGCLGDSSMVPGCLLIGLVIIGLIAGVGFLTGNFILQVK